MMKNKNFDLVVEKIINMDIAWNKYPKISELKSIKLRSFLILYIVKNVGITGYLSAPQISNIISLKFKKFKTSPQSVRAALNSCNIGYEIDIKHNKIIKYTILQEGIKELPIAKYEIEKEFSARDTIIPDAIFKKATNYLKKVVYQINGCFSDGYYDACYVMIRRLFETLIIENYESHNLSNEIKGRNGHFLMLGDLIKKVVNEGRISSSSNTRRHLPKIKLFGDTAAHSRKIILKSHDIERYRDEIRLCAEDLYSNLSTVK